MSPILTLALALFAPFQQQAEDGRGQSLFDKDWHAARRQSLMEKVTKGPVILRGAPTGDDYREFRQDNNFWYFTGLTTPNAVLILEPDGTEHLFVPDVEPLMERWMGDLIDPEEAREITGIANSQSIGGPVDFSGRLQTSKLEEALAGLASKYEVFYVQTQPAETRMMSRDQLQSAARGQESDPYDGRLSREGQFQQMLEEKHGVEVKDITVLLDGLRVVKTPEEVEAMRECCRISGLGHVRAMESAEADDYEWQLAARMTSEFLQNGSRGPGYTAIVGSGPNACTLHYPTNTRRIQSGDLVLIDYGAEYNFFVADITRTWPVDSTFDERQREVYQAVYDAQEAAFAECKPGSNLMKVNAAAQRVISERGFGRMWHGTSHFLGMAVHDVGRMGAAFEPGMVLTVEPGIYLPEEGFGVRIEDVVAITEDGYDLLSSSIPRSVEAIEALRAAP